MTPLHDVPEALNAALVLLGGRVVDHVFGDQLFEDVEVVAVGHLLKEPANDGLVLLH